MTTIYHGYTETAEQTQTRWERTRAKIAYNRIVSAVGKENADKMITRDFLTMSWKEIRIALEKFADLAEAQVEQRAEAQERADLYEIGMGR